MEVLPKMPDASVDLVVTDPPYMISREAKIARSRNPLKRGKFKGKDISFMFGAWDIFESEEQYWEFIYSVLNQLKRILRKGAHLLMFFDKFKITPLVEWCKKNNFIPRQPLYWLKTNPVPMAGKVSFMNAHEYIFWATKETTSRKFACVSEDTECLTDSGWKKYYEISPKDRIATFNLLSENIEFHYPNNIAIYDYDGELIRIKNKEIDCLVTPNHRVLIKKLYSNNKNWYFIEASQLKGKHFVIPVSGYNKGEISLPESFIKILGWVITEGHINEYSCITISQSESKNHEYCLEIKNSLDNEKIEYSTWISKQKYKNQIKLQRTFYIKKESAKKILYWIKNKDKLLKLPSHQLRILFNTLIKGDGSTRSLTHFGDTRWCFIQKDKEIVDWFVRLCTLCGFKTKVSLRKDRSCYYVYVCNRNYTRFNTNLKKEYIRYKGKVWCPSVPNSCFVARRNNTIFITGNTFHYELGQHPDYFSCPIVPTSKHIERHPTQKPVKVIKWLLEYLSNKDDIVLDPFLGSGTTMHACLELARNCIGVEINPEYINVTKKRLNWGHSLGDVEFEFYEFEKP